MRVLMIYERYRYSGYEDPAVAVEAALHPGADVEVATLYEDNRRIDGSGSATLAPRPTSGYRRRWLRQSVGCSGCACPA